MATLTVARPSIGFLRKWAETPPAGVLTAQAAVPGTGLVFTVATIVGLLATAFSSATGWANLLGDSTMHLVMSQRIVSGADAMSFLTVGNLGTVWLPFAHMALIPFTSIPLLYWSGLSGGILGALCLGISAAAIYRTAIRIRLSRLAALTATAIFVLNPTILYLHTTAMMEPVLLATTTVTIAGLAGWITSEKAYSPGEMAVFVGLPAALAVVTRYDGWAFAVATAIIVAACAQHRWGSWRFSLKLTAGYLLPPLVAMTWWLVGNYSTFGDPLAFQRGPYSAQTQQNVLASLGLLPTKGSLATTFTSYGLVLLWAAGALLLAVAAIGVVLQLRSRGPFAVSTMILALSCYSIPFYLLSLYIGQCVIYDEVTSFQDLFNVRYAAPAIPGIALLCGVTAQHALNLGNRNLRKAGFAAVVGALVVSLGYWAASPVDRVAVVREASQQAPATAADAWMKENYDGGKVLITDLDPVTYRSGIPTKNVLGPYRSAEYLAALSSPSQSGARWVYARPELKVDEVWPAVLKDESFYRFYEPVYGDSDVRIFKRIGA